MGVSNKMKSWPEVQLQQEVIHYKSEAQRLKREKDKLEQQYDVKKMNEIISEVEELAERNRLIEKSYREAVMEKKKLQTQLVKNEEEKSQMKNTLLEIEKIKEDLTAKELEWKKEKEELLQKLQHAYDTSTKKTPENFFSKAVSEQADTQKVEGGSEPDQQEKNKQNYEQFFQAFQAGNNYSNEDED